MAEIKRSTGVNESEKVLGHWCDRAFLEAWTYLNPHRSKGTELCDALVVFNGHILIFQIKEIKFSGGDVHTAWERWKRRAITKQLKSLEGAKKWILNHPDRIYLDAACKQRLPIDIGNGDYKIHKILVANGSAEAGKKYFEEDIAGSLMIFYGHPNRAYTSSTPFMLVQDKQDPVHVLDDRSLAIVLEELDTGSDFTEYLLEKERAIQKYRVLGYRGEEELLGHYLVNFDERNDRYYIGVEEEGSSDEENVSDLIIEENAWHVVSNNSNYKKEKAKDKDSYLWDWCMLAIYDLAVKRYTTGNDDLFAQKSAIYEMAKEPRHLRRKLAKKMIDFLEKQKNSTRDQTLVALCKSYYESTAYVFLVADHPSKMSKAQFLKGRKNLLAIACGAAKNSNPQFTKIVGITFGLAGEEEFIVLGDFILLDCSEWSEEKKSHYEEANKFARFFIKNGA